MSGKSKSSDISRRLVLKLLSTVPAIPLLGIAVQSAAADEIVEVNGWILKRSDLERRVRK